MRVNEGGVQGMSRNRRQQHPTQCKDASVKTSRGNQCRGDAGLAPTKLRDGACGSYSQVRHNSAVFEHDYDTNRRSLVHTVSEVREEMQLGLSHGSSDHAKSDGYGSDEKGGQRKSGLVRQVSRESHEFSQETYSASSSPAKKGHINSFVFKNYSLHDRRTLSLPVGKEYSISQYATEVQTHLDRDSNSRNVTYSERHTSVSSTSSCDGSDGSRIHDFDMEAERHSKSTLFFQAGSTLLTVMVAMFILYFGIRFLTTATRNYRGEGPRLQLDSPGIPQEGNSVCSQCRLFAKACPLLGLLTAGLVVVVGAWVSDGRLWPRWSSTPSTCGHCDDYDDNRRHAEEADEKVRQADRSKQQFMAYVFHNIRVPFNAIVLGLGHIRELGDGGGTVGSGADRMDLVQMMLDCAETMTSVLDDVTDMGQWEGGQMELHKDEFDILAVIKFLSWGLKDLLEQKEIAFNMNIDDLASKLLTSHRVIGDKQRVVQTLGNFLSNAVKFTPSGGKLDLDLRCEEVVESKNIEEHVVSSSPNAATSEGCLLGAVGSQILSKTASHVKSGVGKVARLRLSVKDNGIGISTQDQAKLFEPYSFVTSGWVLKAGVSGLGLSMAKRFVERAGGSIGVESEEGSGSTFFFSIPFPLAPVDVSSEREQVKADPGGAVLQKSEVTQSTSSLGVTVVHESITLTRRRATMKEEPTPSANVKEEPTPSAKAKEEPTPSAMAEEEPTPSAKAKEEPTPSANAKEEPTPSAKAKVEPTPSAKAKVEPTPSAKAKEEPTLSAKAKEEPIPAANVKLADVPYAKCDSDDVGRRTVSGCKEEDTSEQISTKVGIDKQESSRAGGRRRKVLLVEDTRINRIILRKVLLNLNLECDEAENGQVAVDLYRQGRKYDLVLMDKEMPVMDGHEATRQLRSMGVRTPIVALTGNALTTDRELFFKAGVDDFQTKPLSRDKLVQLLARYGVENSCLKRT